MKPKTSTVALMGFIVCAGYAAVIEHKHHGYLFVAEASAAGKDTEKGVPETKYKHVDWRGAAFPE